FLQGHDFLKSSSHSYSSHQIQFPNKSEKEMAALLIRVHDHRAVKAAIMEDHTENDTVINGRRKGEVFEWIRGWGDKKRQLLTEREEKTTGFFLSLFPLSNPCDANTFQRLGDVHRKNYTLTKEKFHSALQRDAIPAGLKLSGKGIHSPAGQCPKHAVTLCQVYTNDVKRTANVSNEKLK
ncbi:hypothetical protein JOB18_000625, partial [Solea senegalensis]